MFIPTLDDPPLQAVRWEASGDPWQVMVACVLLNQTSRRQVDAVWPELFDLWPTARRWVDGDRDAQREMLAPLGLGDRRDRLLFLLSWAWVARFPRGFLSSPARRLDLWRHVDVTRYPGLGRYAQDSFRMFVLGDVGGPDRPLECGDPVLAAWWMLANTNGWRLCSTCRSWSCVGQRPCAGRRAA
jgi:hypothetical protein